MCSAPRSEKKVVAFRMRRTQGNLMIKKAANKSQAIFNKIQQVFSIRKTYFDQTLGARSRYFKSFCLILIIMTSKPKIGRERVFHLQNHGHITNKNDFPAV